MEGCFGNSEIRRTVASHDGVADRRDGFEIKPNGDHLSYCRIWPSRKVPIPSSTKSNSPTL